MSWQDRNALVEEKRREAIADIQDEWGEDAIFPFALSVGQPELVAQVLAPQGAAVDVAAGWAQAAIEEGASAASDTFLGQVLLSASWNDLSAMTDILSEKGLLATVERRQRYAEHLPGRPVGWRVAEALGDGVASAYWNKVHIRFWDDTDVEDIEHAVEELLAFQRPRAAFSAVEIVRDRLSPGYWVRILQAIAQGEEPDGPFPSAYHLDEVLHYLDTSEEVSTEQIVNLELPFIPLLCNYGHRQHDRKLTVHRELARDPKLFVQLLTWLYRRRDRAIEPEQKEFSAERREFVAQLAYHALTGWREVPGGQENGEIDGDEFTTWPAGLCNGQLRWIGRKLLKCILGQCWRALRVANLGRLLPECVLDFLNRPEQGGLRRTV